LLLKKITFRPLKNIDIASFASDLAQLPVINDQVRRVRLCLRNTTLGFFRFSTSMFHGYLSQWFFALCVLGSIMRSLRREEFADERRDDGDCVS
jgi:hypothetical protein